MEATLDAVALVLIGAALGLGTPLFLKANGTRPLLFMPMALSLLFAWAAVEGLTADSTLDVHARRIAGPVIILGCVIWSMRRRGH